MADLAARCAERDHPEFTENVLENIESGRRDSKGKRRRTITIDELIALAYCLDIAPVHLIAGLDDDALFPITPDLAVPAIEVRNWIRGWPHSRDGLPGTDGKRYRDYVPDREDVMVTVTEAEWDALQGGRLRPEG